jgi:hypothetical protein
LRDVVALEAHHTEREVDFSVQPPGGRSTRIESKTLIGLLEEEDAVHSALSYPFWLAAPWRSYPLRVIRGTDAEKTAIAS